MKLLALLVFSLLSGAFVPGGGEALAQEPQVVAEAAWSEALASYREILEARDAALRTHDILMDRQEEARRSGDDARARDAMRQVHDQGIRVMLLEQQLRMAADALQAAGRAYLAALEVREEELLDALGSAILPMTRTRLQSQIAELRQEYREVERESGTPQVGELRPLPDVVVDRRDGPEELRGKAGLLENRAAEYDSVIAGLEREISTRERRLQLERGREDLMAGISRFDDAALTGGGIPRSGTEVRPGSMDPVGEVDLSSLPLEDQIALLREYLVLARDMRNEALAMARVFRDRAEGVRP
ncbi:MAG: hypothetical protein EA422_09435 [Gemmatimonadales bacterium]|nr:MAG: hypothetical protein EA422_09435 [Gemmatimonadales bacterium]